MAVIEVSEPIQFRKRFIGLAADRIGLVARAGSEFFAYDTGKWYINRDGGTTWDIVAVS